jgi:hypothetical protein
MRPPIVACLSFVLAALTPVPAGALTWTEHLEQYDPSTDSFRFRIAFTTTPDWSVLDAYGYQRDAFQYWITWAIQPGNMFYPMASADVVIRGGELHLGGELRIRDGTHMEGDPDSGGWGPIRGTVPWTLTNNTIEFIVPRALIGDDAGIIQYYMLCGEFGAPFAWAAGITSPGPVPVEPGSWGRLKASYR